MLDRGRREVFDEGIRNCVPGHLEVDPHGLVHLWRCVVMTLIEDLQSEVGRYKRRSARVDVSQDPGEWVNDLRVPETVENALRSWDLICKLLAESQAEWFETLCDLAHLDCSFMRTMAKRAGKEAVEQMSGHWWQRALYVRVYVKKQKPIVHTTDAVLRRAKKTGRILVDDETTRAPKSRWLVDPEE